MSSEQKREYTYTLRVPKDRLAVLIGKKGEIKKVIEKETGIKITIESKEGEASLKGKNPLSLFTAQQVIKAIARGFSPDIALQLTKPEYLLEIIPIKAYAKTKEDVKRLRGRIIGEKGKSRKTIENITGTEISVYGNTIAIVGEYEGLLYARRAIEALLRGSPHAKAYALIERFKKQSRR